MDALNNLFPPQLLALLFLAAWFGLTVKLWVTRARLTRANHEAWGLIANAFHGDWVKAPDQWRRAAENWREVMLGNVEPLSEREQRIQEALYDAREELRKETIYSHDLLGRMHRQVPPEGDATVDVARRIEFMSLIGEELKRAYGKHGSPRWGRHEFWGVFEEEVDELKQEVQRNGTTDALVKEMAQSAAMLFRFYETGNRYSANPTDL